MKCELCPRKCGIEREESKGFCQSGEKPVVARAGLHMWEEPCISGERGSGTVFFSGCTLKCVFCQNYDISHRGYGKEISAERLGIIFDELYEKGAHNINLVNAVHFTRVIYDLFESGYKKKIPIIYNSSGYENIETLRMLEGIIDIYLPDFKYYDNSLAYKYSGVSDYYEIASAAVGEMYRQVGNIKLNNMNIAEKGMLIRHLVMPGLTSDSVKIVDHVEKYFSNEAYMSLMSQFIPAFLSQYISEHSTKGVSEYKEINRKLTTYEYEKVCSYCISRGFSNIYIQKRESAHEIYIPLFDLSGV